MRMRPWLEEQINSNTIPGLKWLNKVSACVRVSACMRMRVCICVREILTKPVPVDHRK